MRFWRSLLVSVSVVIFAFTFIPKAHAGELNQKVFFTFNQPVEIPGTIIGPGTYVFKVSDVVNAPNLVQVFDKNEMHLLGTFIANTEYSPQPYDTPCIILGEAPEDAPPAILAWFYPGDSAGHEFVYPRNRAVQLANAPHQELLATPSSVAAKAILSAGSSGSSASTM